MEAQVATAKISLDQAVANHQAGTAPLLDELRARVDYQSLEQQLIVARNSLEKDKLALARVIGLPLAQSFTLTDNAPYAAFDQIDVDAAIHQAHANRKDLAAMVEQTKAAEAAAQGGHRRPVSHTQIQRRLRRYWHHAGSLARHRRRHRHAERSALQGI